MLGCEEREGMRRLVNHARRRQFGLAPVTADEVRERVLAVLARYPERWLACLDVARACSTQQGQVRECLRELQAEGLVERRAASRSSKAVMYRVPS